MPAFTAVLDRVADGVAVFVADDGRTFFTEADRLWEEMKEGCVVRLGLTDDDAVTLLGVLPEETAARRGEARKLFEKLKNGEIKE